METECSASLESSLSIADIVLLTLVDTDSLR